MGATKQQPSPEVSSNGARCMNQSGPKLVRTGVQMCVRVVGWPVCSVQKFGLPVDPTLCSHANSTRACRKTARCTCLLNRKPKQNRCVTARIARTCFRNGYGAGWFSATPHSTHDLCNHNTRPTHLTNATGKRLLNAADD